MSGSDRLRQHIEPLLRRKSAHMPHHKCIVGNSEYFPEAWAITTGQPNIRVAIIDSGRVVLLLLRPFHLWIGRLWPVDPERHRPGGKHTLPPEPIMAGGSAVNHASRLLSAGVTARPTGAAASSRVRQQQVPEQYDVYSYSRPVGVTRWGGAYGWYGWGTTPNVRREQQMRTQVRTQERLKGNLSANEIMRQIENATADIRRAMTQKYNVEF